MHTVVKTSFIFLLLLTACSVHTRSKVDYTFEAALNVKGGIESISDIDFEPFDHLDLGFFKGNVAIKLEVRNGNSPVSCVVQHGDLINRQYRFYKLDTITGATKEVYSGIDLSLNDHRTFNDPKPNFKIDLASNEKATFFIYTESDGRITQATPTLLSLSEYSTRTNRSSTLNLIFYSFIGLLLLINLFHWSVLRNTIYYYYGFYILSSCLMYLSVEGGLYGLGFSIPAVDHSMFVFIRIWVVSIFLFTSKFLDIQKTLPKYFHFLIITLSIYVAGTTLYQFIFYDTSIMHLHMLENMLGFLWIILIVLGVILSYKLKRIESKYYLIAFSFLASFVALGLIDSHYTILPGDPFSYFKIGTIIEFIGFTHFIVLIVKSKLNQVDKLEFELDQNQKKLLVLSEKLENQISGNSSNLVLEKTDLLSIFKMLESSMSSDSNWNEFKQKFEELKPGFIQNLLNVYPSLTKSEIRLLLLIKIGYTQKETAEILGIAPDSVKKAKNRVRKKMGLSRSVILQEHLMKF